MLKIGAKKICTQSSTYISANPSNSWGTSIAMAVYSTEST